MYVEDDQGEILIWMNCYFVMVLEWWFLETNLVFFIHLVMFSSSFSLSIDYRTSSELTYKIIKMCIWHNLVWPSNGQIEHHQKVLEVKARWWWFYFYSRLWIFFWNGQKCMNRQFKISSHSTCPFFFLSIFPNWYCKNKHKSHPSMTSWFFFKHKKTGHLQLLHSNSF